MWLFHFGTACDNDGVCVDVVVDTGVVDVDVGDVDGVVGDGDVDVWCWCWCG